jgi:hypothetical protein
MSPESDQSVMPDKTNYTSGSYQIEMLKGNNWMPWKRQTLAVLRDQQLDKYIESDAKPPTQKDPKKIEDGEEKEIEQWHTGDAKARTRIELAIGDAEMVHIIGATIVSESLLGDRSLLYSLDSKSRKSI